MYIQSVTNRSSAVNALLVFVTLLPLYAGSYWYRTQHPYGSLSTPRTDHPSPSGFIRSWLDIHVVQPFNPSPIAAYCNRTEWHSNLVFDLDNANGGIGNVRGNILDFLLYAIEAGASIILPGMATRSQDNLADVWASRAPFDLLFDEDWFLIALSQTCPQMAIYKPEKGQEMAKALPGNYWPRSRRVDLDGTNTKKAYREHLDEWLKSKAEFVPDNLTLVNVERTLWEVDTRSVPRGFRRNFGQLLRVNPTIRRLAAVIVQNLVSRYLILRFDAGQAIPRRAFYGAHLRTEHDARVAGWLDAPYANYSSQTRAYMNQALANNLNVIYVASGNTTDLAAFKAKAAAHAPPLNVTSKMELLPPSDLHVLKQLSWDQQALVDYEVLQRSSVFSGLVKSSFSYNIAMTRNQWL
ncbi:hypothetical protein BAUCODRAFT_149349 [Baudoinia panamericana UAMH 10762]|uniref:Alternative oxidase n=1 Tax=Baudoinia panamericana (strain UAMH 10762) TaxID=717646 RepID=M2LM12_BAUPA|nr:uncharacterized protein BAUCODRAFT_149349 [Baudoinia panamericana UAMH 10762]EMC95362.1 hypothetical protein BAUCODRAFT_149349 [Baudoinia panamericana UAMH 10762]